MAAEENLSSLNNWKVYIHISPNLKTYVGVTSRDISKRWEGGKGYKSQRLFYRAIQKYGWDNFKHIIIAEGLTSEEASQMEIQWITLYKSFGLSYNVSWGGEGIYKKVSKETRRKISDSRKGRKFGPMSEELKKKLSEAMKGKNVGKIRSKSFIERQRITHTGKIQSEETKKKIAESHYKPIIRIDATTGKVIEYQSIKDAAIQMGDIRYCNNIANCVHGRQKTAMGYKWAFQ